MPYLLNLIYLALALAVSPWLIYQAIRTGKYREGMARKLFGWTPVRQSPKPCAWFHAVSVGEVLLLRPVIARFRQQRPDWDCVLSTTTNTGHDLATKTFPDLCVFYYPLDFTWAVASALRRIRPSLVVLAELELWPNFIAAAKRNGAPVVVINGRMSPRSHRGYARIRGFMRQVLGNISLFAVQNQDYADRLIDLGAAADRVHVTGSVKYDGVLSDRNNPRTRELGKLFGVGKDDLVWIVGSTQAPEEEIALDIYRRLREEVPQLRLFLVPRHKERFDEVADLLRRSGLPHVRRSELSEPLRDTQAIVLLDTLGELGALWGLADIAFVGGSLTQRGGQNMIEPAAYGAAVLFGPHVWNFKETVERLRERGAAVQVRDQDELEAQVRRLCTDVAGRQRLGEAAREFVQSQQGATERTLALLLQYAPSTTAAAAA